MVPTDVPPYVRRVILMSIVSPLRRRRGSRGAEGDAIDCDAGSPVTSESGVVVAVHLCRLRGVYGRWWRIREYLETE